MTNSTALVREELNGVDITGLLETVEAVKGNSNLAKFNFRLNNRWINGSQNQSTIADFKHADSKIAHQKASFVLNADEPEVLLGQDNAANPGEYMLHALAACLTTSLAFQAAANGIKVERIESTVEGNMDVQGFLGLCDKTRNGFQNIKASFKVKSDAAEDVLESLMKKSPMFDTILNPVPIEVCVECK